ncbi:GAF domain-containing sensor histidine kinase [Occultella aeris]|uniref:Redox sensor histidine kinase response regulator DevS n=1 Tax=Occultella aeris TaxID=2761496 RepID=A0A7M4DN18_9MICO|nr:GAF domain-containing protein [Occultella aeris]VZO38828.1 Redox sensor histidine kinase response regulator DevS [Occultella aeris]
MTKFLDAVLSVTSHLHLDDMLANFVQAAADLTGAKYAAIGVLDAAGETETFVQHGVDPVTEAVLEHPHGRGILAEIPTDGVLMLSDLTAHPRFQGFPEGHPMMRSFLGVPVRVADQVYGRLYLSEKAGGDFTDTDAENIRMLAAAAAIAVQNSRLYKAARTRERWLAVGQEITTALLSGLDVEDALALIARKVRKVADADTAVVVLPGLDDSWLIEFADGDPVGDLVGIVMPPDGRAMTVLAEKEGIIVDSFARARNLRIPEFGRYGPSLYAPLVAEGQSIGVLILLRNKHAPEFTESDLNVAESIARQAALALKLAEARQAQDLAGLVEERARIARDLHDMAIQQLFATGLQLAHARDQVPPERDELRQVLATALDGVDDSVRQIRAIVQNLRSPNENAPLLERLRRETSLARTGLGFAPSLVLEATDPVTGVPQPSDQAGDDLDARVDADLADDVVAVVREGLANAARHARASSVHVRLAVGPEDIEVVVTDDGVGLDPERTRSSGLDNLATRARRHGGEFRLGPGPDGGTSLVWTARSG